MTAAHAKIMQATGNLHDHIRHTICGQTEDVFDNAAPFHASNHMFHHDADTGDQTIQELVPNTQLLASGFFWWLGQDPGWLIALKARILVEGAMDRLREVRLVR